MFQYGDSFPEQPTGQTATQSFADWKVFPYPRKRQLFNRTLFNWARREGRRGWQTTLQTKNKLLIIKNLWVQPCNNFILRVCLIRKESVWSPCFKQDTLLLCRSRRQDIYKRPLTRGCKVLEKDNKGKQEGFWGGGQTREKMGLESLFKGSQNSWIPNMGENFIP